MRFPTVLLLAALACSATAAETRDPKAVEIAESVAKAMGGKEAREKARYLQFSFLVVAEGAYRTRRTHLWDTWEGRYRYESMPDGGPAELVLFNTNTKQGDVYLDRVKASGEEAAKALEGAYGAYINDVYWLMMPWKWLDPGVSLKYVGEEEYGGKACDVVELSFEQVGLTPGDVYRAYVSRESGLMIRWTYTLQSGRTGDWEWDYTDAGPGIKLASNHRSPDGTQIRMGTVVASPQVADETLFTAVH